MAALVISLFAWMEFIMPVQATIGTHTITAEYYKAYIYDDHDGWFKGAGEWYFGIKSPVEDYTWTGKISRDGRGWCDFLVSRTWTVSGSLYTWFEFSAQERDDSKVDWESALSQTVLPPKPVNAWVEVNSGEYLDVDHYYRYRISNDPPTVGSLSDLYVTDEDSVSFTAPTVTDPEGDSVSSYEWDFGDESTSTVKDPTHRYAGVGKYTVTFKAKDYFGAESNTETMYVIVSPVFRVTLDYKTYEIRTRSDCYPVEDFSCSVGEKSISFKATFPVKRYIVWPYRFPFTYRYRVEGWVEVSIPKSFMGTRTGSWTVTIEGNPPETLTPTETATETTLYMKYIGGEVEKHHEPEIKTVTIKGTWIVPEFPTATLTPLLMIVTLAAVILGKRALTTRPKERVCNSAPKAS